MITDTNETKQRSAPYVREGSQSLYIHIKRVVSPSHKNGIVLAILPSLVWEDYVERLVTGIPKFTMEMGSLAFR